MPGPVLSGPMSADRFQDCLAVTLDKEGGWSNNPHDKGGPTMRGIIQTEYDAYRERKSLPRQTVRNIGQDELRDIYRGNYWWPSKADQMPSGLDLEVFDFSVHSGPTRAIRCLQGCLGIVQDGHIGTITIDAANRADTKELLASYMTARRKFLRGLGDYRYFGAGWERRCTEVQASALAMEAGSHVAPSAKAVEVADAQAHDMGKAVAETKPASNATVAVATATAATSVATAVNQAVQAPPQPIVDTVQNISAWQALGQQIAGFGRFVWSSPVEVGIIVALVAAVWFAPRLLPKIWSRQSWASLS